MKLLIAVATLISLNAFADTKLEVLGGGLTYHIMDDGGAAYNSNKVTSDGRLIANPEFGINIVDEGPLFYQSLAFFGGQNSVGLPMGGSLYERGLVIDHLQLGLAAGFYMQDDNAFRRAGEEPFRLTEVNGTGVIPILGVAVNYKIPLTNLLYLRINNVLSPVITNSSLSIGWDF